MPWLYSTCHGSLPAILCSALQVKAKGERKINFQQFLDALDQLARTKYPGTTDEDALGQLYSQVLDARGPKTHAATETATGSGIFSRLTDSGTYTGAHKHRFDESGAGRGKAGRTDTDGVSDLSQMTRTHLNVSGSTTRSTPGSARRTGAAGASPVSSPPIRKAGAAVAAASPGERVGGSSGYVSGSSSAAMPAAPAPSGSDDPLQAVFFEYCAFGGSASSSASMMDNVKFSKMCREAKIIGGGLTPASVDITFSKVKEKGKRAIDFDQFQMALELLSREKFARMDRVEAYNKVVDMVIAAGGPKAVGATSTSTKGNIFDKLTDASTYTGAHKHRFDTEGRGRGLAGRDRISKGGGGGGRHLGGAVSDLSQITRPNLR